MKGIISPGAQISVVCLNVGSKYSERDVVNLYQMVKRNTTYAFNFTCIRDEVVPTVWNKLLYFGNVFEFESEVCVAFDLDIVIRDNIDTLFNWALKQEKIGVCYTYWREDIKEAIYWRDNIGDITPYNSSILTWKPAVNYNIQFGYEDIEKWNGIDWFLFMEDVAVELIPQDLYYSVYFENYKEKDFPICLFNKAAPNSGLDNQKNIRDKCPWINKYV
jgi:hypothetical protein